MRRDPETDSLELANYSVKEFLEGIDKDATSKYVCYRFNAMDDALELAMTCLTYLCFVDFDLDQPDEPRKVASLMNTYKFLGYCVSHWHRRVRVQEIHPSVIMQLQHCFKLPRTNQFITWVSCLAFIDIRQLDDTEPHGSSTPVDDTKMAARLSDMADSSPLHRAADLCLPSMCQWLIANGCDSTYASAYSCRPFDAVMLNLVLQSTKRGVWESQLYWDVTHQWRLRTINVLIIANVVSNEAVDYAAPLGRAIFEDDPEIVQLLLDSGALCDREDLDQLAGGSSQMLSIFRNLKEENTVVGQLDHHSKLAVSSNSGLDRTLKSKTVRGRVSALSRSDKLSLFFNAVKFGRLQIIEDLAPSMNDQKLEKGLNLVNREGESALHIASDYNHSEIVKLLVSMDVDLNLVDDKGRSPLLVAAQKQNFGCVNILLGQGADVRLGDLEGYTPLHEAVTLQSSRMLDTIMQTPTVQGPSLYTRTSNDGSTLLRIAAYTGSLPVIESVLSYFHEASIDERSSEGSTCLHVAAESKFLSAVNFFLDRGMSPNCLDNAGRTPIFYAISRSRCSTMIFKLLHSRGGDVNIACPDDGDTALFTQISMFNLNCNENEVECFEYLLENTTDVNHCNAKGTNALHRLFQNLPFFLKENYIERVCRALLEHGCSLAKCNAQGLSPFQILVSCWSAVRLDSEGCFSNIFDVAQSEIEDEDDNDLTGRVSEYTGYRSQIGITMFLLKYTSAYADVLGQCTSIQCQGASLLSLAVKTRDPVVIRQILEYDTDVDLRDTLPGFSGHPLRPPLEQLCVRSCKDRKLIETFLA